MLLSLLLCCTAVLVLVEVDVAPPCGAPPMAYTVELIVDVGVLVGVLVDDASSGDCVPPVVCSLQLSSRPHTVETSPSAKVVL